jgi:hypothetical protein
MCWAPLCFFERVCLFLLLGQITEPQMGQSHMCLFSVVFSATFFLVLFH